MEREQDFSGQDVSLFSLMAQTLQNLDAKQEDLPGTVAVLSLFALMNIVNLAQEQVVKGTGSGGKDIAGMLTGMLSQGQKPGPEMLTSLLQKSGKKLNPQMLSTLLSLAGEAAKQEEPEAGESGRQKPDTSERRQKRGNF